MNVLINLNKNVLLKDLHAGDMFEHLGDYYVVVDMRLGTPLNIGDNIPVLCFNDNGLYEFSPHTEVTRKSGVVSISE